MLHCRGPCDGLLERRAQTIAEVLAFTHLMLETPVHWISNLICLRTQLLVLSPAQRIAAHHMLDVVQRYVPRDWSIEALHSFSMWMPMEMQDVINGINHIEVENQSQAAVEAEADAVLMQPPTEHTN